MFSLILYLGSKDFLSYKLESTRTNYPLFVCRKKMPLKEVGNLKAKKSPSGWRSIFSKGNRQSSIKHKNHKSGLSRKKDLLNFSPISIINSI